MSDDDKPKKPGNSSKRDARKIAQAEKANRALAMRRIGASYEQIAKELGYANRSGVYKLVQQAIRDLPKENAEEVFALDDARLDFVIRSLHKRVSDGDPKSAQAYLQALKRRADMYGYDAPKRAEISGPDGGPIEVTDASERIASKLARILAEAAGDSGKPDG